MIVAGSESGQPQGSSNDRNVYFDFEWRVNGITNSGRQSLGFFRNTAQPAGRAQKDILRLAGIVSLDAGDVLTTWWRNSHPEGAPGGTEQLSLTQSTFEVTYVGAKSG